MPLSLTRRVRARLNALVERNHVEQRALASAIGRSQGMVSLMLSNDPQKQRGIDLDYLPALAQAVGVEVSDLVVPPESTLIELTSAERELILLYRDFPAEIQQAVNVIWRRLPKAGNRGKVYDIIRSVPESRPRR